MKLMRTEYPTDTATFTAQDRADGVQAHFGYGLPDRRSDGWVIVGVQWPSDNGPDAMVEVTYFIPSA